MAWIITQYTTELHVPYESQILDQNHRLSELQKEMLQDYLAL